MMKRITLLKLKVKGLSPFRYVTMKYGQATVIFDGYTPGPITKDGAHARRSKSEPCPTIQFTNDMSCIARKDKFLSNSTNKQTFILMLSTRFKQGRRVHHASADADLLIAQTAIASANQNYTVLVGEDTDLLVLLGSLAENLKFKLYFRPESKAHSTKQSQCWDIGLLQQSLGKDVCDKPLFIHAMLGCDTNSRLFGIGKAVAHKNTEGSA